MKCLLSFILLFSLTGCGYFAAHGNRDAISAGALHDGMTKQQVIETLGNPFKLEHPEPDVELLYYEIDPLAGSFCMQYTPIRLIAGIVAQWGGDFCKEPGSSSKASLDKHLKQ